MKRFFDPSLGEVHSSVDIDARKTGWKKVLAFLGPAYLVSVGYMDPGNWATDLAGGSKYGYSLIWVLLMSNLMALLLQSLSARLGIVRGLDLAQANREAYPKYINYIYWLLAEIAIAATDLAEVLGMAIGFQLLTGLPLLAGVFITILDTFLLLYLQKLGIRKMEAFIVALIAVIGVCFLINIILANPSLNEVIKGFIPSLPDPQTLYQQQQIKGPVPTETALYLAVGIIGATVMPHNLYLHSALVQSRKINPSRQGIKQALKWNFIDSTIALNLAFLINAAILVLAASVFFKTGRTDIGEIKQAHELLSPVLGNSFASTLFAIALIAAGQSSTVTGTLAGQIVMEGYLHLRINPVMRRLITRLLAVIPAGLIIWLYGEEKVDSLLIFSQVLLSVQLGFAIIPLIHFVSDKETMGEFRIKLWTKIAAWLIAAILVYLNARMVIDEALQYFNESGHWFGKALIILAFVFFAALLLYSILFPFLTKRRLQNKIQMHPTVPAITTLQVPTYRKVAVAMDFGEHDEKMLAAAIGQTNRDGEFILIHIVESTSAIIHGQHTLDVESKMDQERLDALVNSLQQAGYNAKGILGYRNSAREIVRIVKEEQADILLLGAHGHAGFKDWFYGATINTVRHELKIPVLIINL